LFSTPTLPVELALKYGDGKAVSGQYGGQVLYSLTDGRVMYVPPIVRKQIEDLEMGRGELFTITNTEKNSGRRRTVEWRTPEIRPAQDRKTGSGSTIRKWPGRASDPTAVSAQFLKQALALAVDAVAEAERSPAHTASRLSSQARTSGKSGCGSMRTHRGKAVACDATRGLAPGGSLLAIAVTSSRPARQNSISKSSRGSGADDRHYGAGQSVS
jgi:hypothetical protein